MSIKIGIADLVANALIELVDNDENQRMVTFEQLIDYGAVVLDFLNARNEEAVLIFSRDMTNSFLHDYSEFFTVGVTMEGKKCITLNDDRTPDELRKMFRGYLSLDMLMAFISDNSLRVLGI